jgi:hypothetical protein
VGARQLTKETVVKLTDIHGKPIVNRRRAVQEALQELEVDLAEEHEDWDDDYDEDLEDW